MNHNLITGSSGFLGSRLLRILNQDQPAPANQFTRTIREWPSPESIHSIFHTAASVVYRLEDGDDLYTNNVKLTADLCRYYPAARIVFSSSVSVYAQDGLPKTETSNQGCNQPYGLSKLWAEQHIQNQSNYAIVRFSSLYGPRMNETTLIPRYCKQAMEDNVIQVWGDGNRKQDYLHVDDACAILQSAMISTANGIFLGTNGESCSNNEIAEIIAGETGAKIQWVNQDNSVSSIFDNTITRSQLNWKPSVEIEDGIKQYLEWKRRQSL
jgi:nucleoside-diphosphate-sugar epimerase